VGFPGETEEDFEDTLSIVKEARYDMMYSFIYSKRSGTPAAEMENQVPEEVTGKRFPRLLALQNEISLERNLVWENKVLRVLVDGKSKNNPDVMSGRTEGNKIVLFSGSDDLVGKFVNIKISKCETFALLGDVVE
jgi:tRNA-2-methylthio-N6-dimethylallyladenosine synthase